MWYIVVQNPTHITCIYLTSSKKKCKKKYDELEKEAEQDGEDRSTFYYMGYCKTGGKNVKN